MLEDIQSMIYLSVLKEKTRVQQKQRKNTPPKKAYFHNPAQARTVILPHHFLAESLQQFFLPIPLGCQSPIHCQEVD